MTIKVKNASQREAVPASPAQITEIQTDLGIVTSEAAQALIDANTDLGALAVPVQTLIDAASVNDRERALHNGTDPATNVLFLDGLPLEVWRQQITAILANNPSAPQITTAPTISGTASVNSTLTATLGTVTGPTHTDTVQWNANGTPIPNATAMTIKLSANEYLKVITVTQTSAATVGGLATQRTSTATSAVSSTLATNSVAPSFSPSGSQATNTTITWSRGTWTGGVSYNVYIKLGGSVILSYLATAATTGTFPLIGSYVGLTLTIEVSAINVDGIASGVTVGSNNVVVTGAAPTLTQVSPPTWVDASIYLEVPATIGEATWNLTPDSITHNFYKNGATTPFRSSNTGLVFTPHAGSDGLIVGDSIVFESIPILGGVTYPAYRSASKTISAASGVFSITPSTASQAGYSWTQGTPISAATLGTIVNGVAPFNVSISPTVAGLSVGIAGSNVVETGTPAVSAPLTSYTVTVTDSSGGVGTIAFRSASSASDGGTRSSAIIIDKPAGVVDGDMLIWAILFDNTGPTVTWPIGWNLVQTLLSTADEASLFVLWKIASGEGSNYTATTDFTDWWATSMAAYSGVANAVPVSSGAADSSATAAPWTVVAPTLTTTQNNARVVWIGAVDTLSTNPNPVYTPPAGYTSRITANDVSFASVNISDVNKATAGATGSVSGTVSGTGSAGKLGALIAFNPTASGSGASVNMTFPATIVTGGSTIPLTSLPIPSPGNPIEGGGVVTYNVVSPTGNGKLYTRHDTPAYLPGISRAELSWRNVPLIPGHDYVFAGEIIVDSTNGLVHGPGGNINMLVEQIHTPGQGDTTPDLALYYKASTNQLFWTSAYNTFPSNSWNYNGGPNPDVQQRADIYTGVCPTNGVPFKFIYYYRPGYLTSHAPRIDIWHSTDNGNSYQQVVNNYTAFNTYNISDNPSLGLGSYPRIGPYWFQGHPNLVTFYSRGSFFGEGTPAQLFARAQAALGT